MTQKQNQTAKLGVELIGPNEAAALLKGNDNNRNLNKRTVSQYARYMSLGEWQMNGETVKITKHGKLLDGQHRLAAVIQSGTKQEFIVVRDLDDKNMETIDVGKKRTIADALTIKGYRTNSNNVLAAATKYVMDFEGGTYARKRQHALSPTSALKFLKKNPGLVDSVAAITGYGKDIARLVSPSVATAMHYLFSSQNKKAADMFFRGLAKGESLPAGSPILALRNKFVLEAAKGKRGGENRHKNVACFVTAWNAYLNGDELKKVSYNPRAEIKLLTK